MTWPVIELGEVLTQYKEYVDQPEDRTYPKLSVKLYGRGVELDTPADGSTLRMKRHQLAKRGQVILSEIWGKKGAIGLVPPEGEGALCTSHFFLFDMDESKVIPGWLHAIFRANYLAEQLDAKAFGTTGYAAVRPSDFLQAVIPLPPLAEQQRIVAKIEWLAGKIDEARGLRNESIQLLSTLYTRQLAGLNTQVTKLEPLSNFTTGTPKNGWSARCDNGEQGAPVLTLSAVTGYEYNATAYKRTSESTNANADYWLNPGDLLITRSNTPELVGHAAIYNGTPAPCIYPDLMMRVPLNKSLVETKFVWYWLQSPLVREYIRSHSKGTSPTMKKISQGIVMNIPFPANYTLEKQRQFIARLDVARSRQNGLKAMQAQTAAELDALLPAVLDRAFRGEL